MPVLTTLLLVLVTVLGAVLLTAVPAASAATTAPDVPAASPIRADVTWATGQKVIAATGDGTFQPAKPVTRQSMALYLYRVTQHRNPPPCTRKPFADVAVGSPYCGAIAWLSSSGVQPGAATAAFSPSAKVSRRVLAGWLYRAAAPGRALPACKEPYSDVPADKYCGVIGWAHAQGVLVGMPTGTYTSGTQFAPKSAVTRGVAATALHRFSDVLVPQTGADVSHPQCAAAGSPAAGPLPRGQAFGVVGVNAGRPKTVNPCLAAQLAWARGSAGRTAQARVQLYVNTANPGKALASSWPASGTNRYGTCRNTDSAACAYEYGRARAKEDAKVAGLPAAASTTWWLDVENHNSWMPDTRLNAAALEGMVAHFRSIRVAGVGLYSTPRLWAEIVGSSVSSTSELRGLPSWVAGAADRGAARRACGSAPFTPGGSVRLVQYIQGGFDRDHSCT